MVCDTCAAQGKTETDPGKRWTATAAIGRGIAGEMDIAAAGCRIASHRKRQPVSCRIRHRHAVHGDVRRLDGDSVWQRIENALYVALPALGDSRLAIINTLGLLVFCVIFIAVYRLVATWIAHCSGNRMTPDAASRAFVLTLVPIAIAYLVAHYLSYFLIQGQLLIRLASDPFGFGWNIFGTAHFRPDIGIVGARFVWYTSLVAIVHRSCSGSIVGPHHRAS